MCQQCDHVPSNYPVLVNYLRGFQRYRGTPTGTHAVNEFSYNWLSFWDFPGERRRIGRAGGLTPFLPEIIQPLIQKSLDSMAVIH